MPKLMTLKGQCISNNEDRTLYAALIITKIINLYLPHTHSTYAIGINLSQSHLIFDQKKHFFILDGIKRGKTISRSDHFIGIEGSGASLQLIKN